MGCCLNVCFCNIVAVALCWSSLSFSQHSPQLPLRINLSAIIKTFKAISACHDDHLMTKWAKKTANLFWNLKISFIFLHLLEISLKLSKMPHFIFVPDWRPNFRHLHGNTSCRLRVAAPRALSLGPARAYLHSWAVWGCGPVAPRIELLCCLTDVHLTLCLQAALLLLLFISVLHWLIILQLLQCKGRKSMVSIVAKPRQVWRRKILYAV